MRFLLAALALWLAHVGNRPIYSSNGWLKVQVKSQLARAPERSRFAIDDSDIYDRPVPAFIEIFDGAIPPGMHELQVTLRLHGRPPIRATHPFDVEGGLNRMLIEIAIDPSGKLVFKDTSR
jgi:hypothetical protein